MALGARITSLTTPTAIRDAFHLPTSIRTSPFENVTGYLNHDGGWAVAADATSLMLQKVKAFEAQGAAKVFSGKKVVELVKREVEGKVVTRGVKCADGSEYEADLVVLATGAWSASAFPELKLQEKFTATG